MAKKQQVNNRVAGLAQVNATNQIAAELVGKIYQAFCKDDKTLIDDVKDYLVKNTKNVLLVTSHKCPYILHSVCYLMLGQGCADVLKRMSVENVLVLKECISVATRRGRPDDKFLDKMLQSVDDEIMLQSGTIAQNVSLFWDDVNAELSAWMAEIVEFQRITSNSQNWLNTKEVAARFGKTPNSAFYKDMEKLAESHPEMANNEVMAVEKDLDTANALQNEKLAKLEAVRAAEEAKRVAEETERVALAALADVDARAAEFLKQHQK